MKKMIKSVAELTNDNFEKVEACPGIYTWWFQESCVDKLLEQLGAVEKKRIQQCTIGGSKYYALYFGIAKSCRQRARWHMAQRHTQSSVQSGYLSTLRQTLSALLGYDMTKAEKKVNDFIGENCYWQWEYTATREEAEDREQHELRTNYYPLNIQGNKVVPPDIIGTLKGLRKKYKN